MRRNLRQIILDGKVARVPLTLGLEAIVDICDIGLVAGTNWTAQVSGAKSYARMNVSMDGIVRKVYMHRLILGFPDGMQVDHINGNGLDNRRENLRPATNAQNQHNRKSMRGSSSRYLGVCWSQACKKWMVRIRKGEKNLHIGVFECEHDAALAYNLVASEMRGPFAQMNVAGVVK